MDEQNTDSNQNDSVQNQVPSAAEPEVSPIQTAVVPDSLTENSNVLTAAPVKPPLAPTPAGSRSGRNIILLLFIILLLVVVAAAVYLVKSGNSSTKKDIALIRVGLNEGDLREVYPYIQFDDTETALNNQIFDGLVKYQNATTIVPDLATSWSNTGTDTWVFNLRRNVTFHDGRTMTASDVKASLDYAIANQNGKYQGLSIVDGDIAKVDILNPYKVRITTNGPDPILLNQLYGLYIFDSHGQMGSPTSGSGAYTIKPGTKPSENHIDLVAYNKYWGGHVYTKALDISIYSSTNGLLTALKNNQLDFAGLFTNDQANSFKSSDFRQLKTPNLSVDLLSVNTLRTNSPLQNLAVREAIRYAINYSVVDKAFGFTGSPIYQLVPPSIPGYDPSIKPISYNLALAKQLLSTVPASLLKQPISLAYAFDAPTVGVDLTNELKAIGLNVQSKIFYTSDDLTNDFNKGQADLTLFAYETNTLDGNDVYQSVANNTVLNNNPQLNDLINQANQVINPTTRIQIMQQAAQLIYKDIPDIPIFSHGYNYVYKAPYNVMIETPTGGAGVYFGQVYEK